MIIAAMTMLTVALIVAVVALDPLDWRLRRRRRRLERAAPPVGLTPPAARGPQTVYVPTMLEVARRLRKTAAELEAGADMLEQSLLLAAKAGEDPYRPIGGPK